jgi:hypothetical protein
VAVRIRRLTTLRSRLQLSAVQSAALRRLQSVRRLAALSAIRRRTALSAQRRRSAARSVLRSRSALRLAVLRLQLRLRLAALIARSNLYTTKLWGVSERMRPMSFLLN